MDRQQQNPRWLCLLHGPATTKHMVALCLVHGPATTKHMVALCLMHRQATTKHMVALLAAQTGNNKTHGGSACCMDRQQQNTWWLCLLHGPATTKHMVALPAAWTGNNKTHGGSLPGAQTGNNKTHGGSLPGAQTGNNKTHGGSACCMDRQQQNTWWLSAWCTDRQQHMVALCLVHRQATTKHMVALPAAWTGNNKTHCVSACCMVRQQQNTWWLCLLHGPATTKHMVALPAAHSPWRLTDGWWSALIGMCDGTMLTLCNSHISLHTADTNCQPVDISSTGYVHFYPHQLAVFKWCALYCVVCMRACMCVCVDGMKLKYALRWHINVSVHSILCQCHKHMYPQTIWGQQTDGAKSGYCPSTLLAWHNIIHFVSLT